MRRIILVSLFTTLTACPPPTVPDAGPIDSGQMMMMEVDSGPPPPPCDSPEDCKIINFDGVCRQGLCRKNVPCSDDLECGLGELCLSRTCAFTGCTRDADCGTGSCRLNSYTCVECGQHSDCPFNKPMCQLATQKCVQCVDDQSCPIPGAPYCEVQSGTCKHCLRNDQCPNGLTCTGNVCSGVGTGGRCPPGTACAEGNTCVNVNSGGMMIPTCLRSCNVYSPVCGMGEICYALKYSNGNSFVFDLGGILGVCFGAGPGKNYRDSCDYNWLTGGNCKAQFMCIPDSALTSTCRAFCDPGAPTNPCPMPEICHPFPGDYNGRQFGLCYNDTGWGTKCSGDPKCRPGQSCQPYDDPSTPDFTANDVGTFCQYNTGTNAGLAPCANTTLPDGGFLTADRTCQSGTCRTDGITGLPPYFCWAACESDSDCNLGARTGTCDSRFPFVAPAGSSSLYGCRPGCQSHASCNEYGPDAGLACTVRLSTLTRNSGLKLECGRPNVFGAGAGATCTSGFQCYSGHCSTDDARGVRRLGYCLDACQSQAECSGPLDAGDQSGPLDCLPTTYLGYRGPDFRVGTPDDVLSVKRVCSGVPCNEDEDCSTDGGARCVPDVSPLDAGAYVLRCRPPVQFGFREGGVPCNSDSECRSGACGRLVADGGTACFRACDPAGQLCPAGLSCQAGAYRFTATAGNTLVLDGCAP